MIRKFLIPVVLTVLLAACTDKPLSPEDEIRQYIETGIEAAENRNTGDLADMVDEHYQDQNGLNKAKLKSMLRFYFLRHKNIFLFKKIEKIDFPSEQEAEVTLYVAMAGSAISDASLLSSLRARVYYFEMELVKPDDEWLLKSARWQRASPGDMQ